MNTTELIERVAAENGVAKEHARKIVASTFAAIIAAAVAGDEVALSGFGRFKVKEVAERQGRNPGTGETITIPPRESSTLPRRRLCGKRSLRRLGAPPHSTRIRGTLTRLPNGVAARFVQNRALTVHDQGVCR